MKKIAVVTVGRSDYGILQPVLARIVATPGLQLQLIVAGAHFVEKFGNTVTAIERDGYPIAARVPLPEDSDTPLATAKAMGLATAAFAEAYAQLQPDILLLLGDRFEMHAAAVAAVPFALPIAHIHGGELTLGAIDDAFRHSITKLSHLHFVSTESYARRVMQMGEEPWRVTVSGAPALDHLRGMQLAPLAEFATRHQLPLTEPPLLVTFHPVTLGAEPIEELLAALATTDRPILFTLPNADHGHQAIIRQIHDFTATHPRAHAVANLGTRDYFSAMAFAAAMVGNSSSGIIEAASFELPVVNIGRRQEGRTRARNVIDVGCSREEITYGLARALAPIFRESLSGLVNPFGSGEAATIIVERLQSLALDSRLLFKHFQDQP